MLEQTHFQSGELYLFHQSNPLCPPSSSLWGLYHDCIGDRICLDSSTVNLHNFRARHLLPTSYRYSRTATRSELRDYMFNLGTDGK